MILKCTEEHRDRLLKYLYQESAYNIFIIGDVEAFGFNEDFLEVFCEIDQFKEIISVFLRYRDNGLFYSHINQFNPEYLKVVDLSKINHMNGKAETMEYLEPYLDDFHKKPMYFCRAKELKDKSDLHFKDIKQCHSREDLSRLYDLLSSIQEFSIHKRSREAFVESHYQSLNKMTTTLYLEKEGRMISTVSTTAETKVNAMVVAVATDKGFRRKGYTTMLMKRLMQIYLEEKNKELCLFYDNPEAGNIYLRLGFEYIGQWNMYERTVRTGE